MNRSYCLTDQGRLEYYLGVEATQSDVNTLMYIKTCKNLADIMTKQSTGPQFRQHRDYALGYIDAIVVAHVGIVLRRRRRVRVRV